jgi:hypothetical protein
MVVCRSLIVLLSFFPLAIVLHAVLDIRFLLFLWCRLITPLVPYGSSLGTFWLPLWYLLITLWYLLLTHLVHCAYLFVTFWLPLWYHLLTPLVHSHYIFVSFGIPSFFHSA